MILLNEVQFLSNAAIVLLKWKSLNFHLESKQKLRLFHLTNLLITVFHYSTESLTHIFHIVYLTLPPHIKDKP